jgi:hypothetical protein
VLARRAALPRLFTPLDAERTWLAAAGAPCPSPETNRRIHGYEVDFAWPAQRLVVEVDGYAFHSSRTVIRITWRQLTLEPEAVVALLARALAS